WWNQIANKVDRAKNLSVFNLPSATSQVLGKLAQRNMQLQCTIQDAQAWINGDGESILIDLKTLKEQTPAFR
ncbi:MAG TPA: YaeQ family protein, partial [Herminiimonas sp.]|nr:YaeQ family protein [Herminiimonas sp.]